MINVPLIEFSNASVRIDQRIAAANVTFNVTRGEFVLLHGPTGSGKSTVLKMICGLLAPTSGEVLVAGERVNEFSEKQKQWLRRSIGVMLPDCPLLEDRCVLENVMLPALASEISPGEARTRAKSALKKCRISALAGLYPRELSAGQRQLTSLARAVVNRPVLILADEPAAHLDADNAQALMDLLGEFSQAGVSVIVASHLQLQPQSVPCRSVNLVVAGEDA